MSIDGFVETFQCLKPPVRTYDSASFAVWKQTQQLWIAWNGRAQHDGKNDLAQRHRALEHRKNSQTAPFCYQEAAQAAAPAHRPYRREQCQDAF
jgi:hypothetical protein